ncbi:MAG: HD domain-containing protein [Rhodospirillaceae bacterium]
MGDKQDSRADDPTDNGKEFAPWVLDNIRKSEFAKGFVDRVLVHLRELHQTRAEGSAFSKVTRLEHCLQTATLAYKAGEDEEYVVVSTLHDIGDLLAPFNHGEFAAAMLEPFVSEKNHWLVANHHTFQGYHYFEDIGLNRNLRDKFNGHPWFEDAINFCENYDMPAFNPELDHMSLEDLEPMIRRLLMAPKKSVWVPNPPHY